ncbi:phospholipase D-like domain-containing protein [Amycolatopsis sp. NPDC047767]|uniref:phospholipase D-like domain-containing protein n=1 Tax=Amycolatopsis sp. NPDC047767 TaxID=3156765 RepID=UPI0034527FFC
MYVHAKLGIVDDEWLTVGSANLDEHELFNVTEVDITTDDRALVRATRLRLWSEHRGRLAAELGTDPAEVVDDPWRPLAEKQASRERRGERRTHRLVLLPGVSRRAGRPQGPLWGPRRGRPRSKPGKLRGAAPAWARPPERAGGSAQPRTPR